MCQTSMIRGGDPHVDRHVLREAQRKMKMEAALGRSGAAAAKDRVCHRTSPQRKSILSRNQSFPLAAGKENVPATSPGVSRLASSSPTKKTPLLGPEITEQFPRYTSLSELVIAIPNSPFGRSASFGTSSPMAPRTPMKDALVEKAVRAYLQPSESFNARTQSSGWRWCLVLKPFLPSFMTKFSIPNPLQFFCCSVHAFSMYMTRRTMPLPLCFHEGPTTCPNWN